MSNQVDITGLYYLRKVKYLRQKEVCQLFGICRTTLWLWENKRGLPAIRKPHINPMYDKDELIKWLKDKPDLYAVNQRVVKLEL